MNDVVTYGGQLGKVVFIIETREFISGFKRAEWEYLNEGIGVELEDATLFHLDEVDEDLKLVRRAEER